MRRLGHLSALLAWAVGFSQPAMAQPQTEQPLIVLDPQAATQAGTDAPPASAAPEPAPDSPPVADAQPVPQIRLPQPAADPAEAATSPELPVIAQRDRGADIETAAAADWLLPPVPAGRLPDTVQIGASQPEPGVLRMTGEVASVDLVLDLPQDAAVPGELVLTLRSAVNVLPEAATMTIGINDAAPVELPLDYLSGFQTITVPTPALTAGTNRLRLDFRQPHRIYCGPEASFGVWTEIRLSQSGVPVGTAAIAGDAAGFALALRAISATRQALPVLAAEDEDPALLRQLAEMLNRLSDGQARVRFRSFYGMDPPSPLSVALIASTRSHVEFREGAAGGLVLQVEHVDGQLPPLDELLPSLPERLAPVPALAPGATTSLADLDQADIVGNTRYFRHEVPFDLPRDWLLLSNEKARLDLRYGFASALPEGATLLVKANGQTIRLLPLDRKGGQMQPPLDIIFAANLLHSGRNHLAFEMMVPGDPPDATCPPRRADMLVVTNDTTLLVPPAPAMGLAGISGPLSRLEPGAITVPEGVTDPAALERAAAELVAGLPPAFGSAGPPVRLSVIGAGDISVIPLEAVEASGRDLQEALFAPVSAQASRGRVTTPVEPARRYQLTEDEPQSEDQPEPAAAEAVSASETADEAGPFSLGAWFGRQVDRLGSAAFIGSNESLGEWLKTQQGSALLLRPDPAERGELWLVLGPQVPVATVLPALVQLRDSGLARGEAAILTRAGKWEVWSPVRAPELRGPLTLTNLRQVLGNYASWSPLLFTVALLGLALLSAIPALLFILFTRRRGQL